MNNNQDAVVSYAQIAQRIRFDALRMTYQAGKVGAHIGDALSLAEIMAVLYMGFIRFERDNPYSEKRDRLIFSKGHGALALYSAMKYAGIITADEFESYKTNHTRLYAHPSLCQELGIEFSSGSLGQGLSLGVGCCLGLRRKNNNTSRVYVILGDGECNEGSVWEAAEAASHFGCGQLTAIIDRNELQYDGPNREIMYDEPLEAKWRAFGWDADTVDGHSVSMIKKALEKKHDQPYVIIAKTVKGKGVSFMENNPQWHNHALTEEQFKRAIKEIGEIT